jgi:hypothetical protein
MVVLAGFAFAAGTAEAGAAGLTAAAAGEVAATAFAGETPGEAAGVALAVGEV